MASLTVNMAKDTVHETPIAVFHGAVRSQSSSSTRSAEIDIIGTSSPGVIRMGIIREALTIWEKVCIFASLFVLAYVYGLDATLRFVYQPHATSGLENHSKLATLNVLRAVIAAAIQPTAAKIADVFGRFELIMISIGFYVVGTIIEASSHHVQGFIVGGVLYQIGFSMVVLLMEVIVADITPLKSRLLFIHVPYSPFLINAWISGNISEKVLYNMSWRLAIGMWAPIFIVASIPLLISLNVPYRRAMKDPAQVDKLRENPTTLKKLGYRKMTRALFWQLDIPGLLGLIISFGCILVPFTIAGGATNHMDASRYWKRPGVLIPLIIGVVLCVPVWIWWESKAGRHALIPFRLLRDRAVWGAFGIACMLNFCWSIQADFLYTVLVVAFGESTKSATRIISLYSFCSVLTGIIVGFVVARYRRLKRIKWIIVIGTLLFMAAFGVLISFRGGFNHADHWGIVGGQILLGVAGGFFPNPALVSVQAATRHEHLAVITGLYLAIFNVGSALGNCVSGAIWTQMLVPTLLKHLPAPYNTATIAESIYASPFKYVEQYPIGTPLRDGIVSSYRHIQKLLSITGICLCILLIIFGLVIRDPDLGDDQSHPNAEKWESDDDNPQIERPRFVQKLIKLLTIRTHSADG